MHAELSAHLTPDRQTSGVVVIPSIHDEVFLPYSAN
jgi:hypothetical protein